MKKAIILLSGGLDSTTCLAQAHAQNYQCYALSFNYGQKHQSELQAAQRIAAHYNTQAHRIVDLTSLSQLTHSSLTNPNQAIPDYNPSDAIPSTYVPARNTIFLAIAMAWAESIQANALFIGVSAIDYSGYPDCRPAFITAFQNLIKQATDSHSPMQQCQLITPLIHLSKAQTIQLGMQLGVNYALTTSCYRANDQGQACGQCDSCVLRKQGFADAGVKDPTAYACDA
jgi:7-cyano-7-deazaguanine synthase